MSVTDQLSREARARARQSWIAGAGAASFIAAIVMQLSGPQVNVSEVTAQLISLNSRFPRDILASLFSALGFASLVWTMIFLFGAARARKPELNPAVRVTLIFGGVLGALLGPYTGGVAYAVILAVKSHQFVHTGAQTYLQAKQLLGSGVLPAVQTLDIAAQFALALGIVLVSLNALRVGLLTRFMGYFGILVGAASILLIGSPPAVALEVFWLLALAYLLSGRWPGGDPPAWRTGRAEPWPSSAEMREQRFKAAGGEAAIPARRSAGSASKRGAPEPAPPAAAVSARSRSTTPKRKRKKRR